MRLPLPKRAVWRLVAVLLACAVVLVGPAVGLAAGATPSPAPPTIYAYDAAYDTSDLTSDARLDRVAAEALTDSARKMLAARPAFVAAETATALSEREIGSTMDDILQNATVKKFSTSSIYDKAGGLTQADTDFDVLTRGVTVVDRGGGLRTATLSNGTRSRSALTAARSFRRSKS